MNISKGGKFGDKKPVRETRTRATGQPKGIEVRVGVFRIVRGREDWVILAKGGAFIRVADLLQEAENWARGETRRLAQVELARTSGHSIEMIQAHGITEADPLPKGRLDWVDEGMTPAESTEVDGGPFALVDWHNNK